MTDPTDEELEAMAKRLEQKSLSGPPSWIDTPINPIGPEAAAMLRACKGRVRVKNIEPDDGFWNSCSGCHETNEGAETGFYPYSPEFQCYLGAGCRECGGIGAVWDNADYSDLDLDPDHSDWNAAIEAAAKVAEIRHEAWAEGDGFNDRDGLPAVSCDVTACQNVATAIRQLKKGPAND